MLYIIHNAFNKYSLLRKIKTSILKVYYKQTLVQYVESRGISANLAKRIFSEVYLRNTQTGKVMFGVGYQNQKGGFEISSKHLKMAVNGKSITLINNKEKHNAVLVFEGMFDMLTYLQLAKNKNQRIKEHIIVTNSVANVDATRDFIKTNGYNKVLFCGDNDEAGSQCLNTLKKELTSLTVQDCRIYLRQNQCKDFNEAWTKNSKKMLESSEIIVADALKPIEIKLPTEKAKSLTSL